MARTTSVSSAHTAPLGGEGVPGGLEPWSRWRNLIRGRNEGLKDRDSAHVGMCRATTRTREAFLEACSFSCSTFFLQVWPEGGKGRSPNMKGMEW